MERLTGTVKWFNAQKGFGFIAPDDGSENLFVHYSSILSNGSKALREGDKVEYEVEKTDKGAKAISVRVIIESPKIEIPKRSRWDLLRPDKKYNNNNGEETKPKE